jgi:hypothetical protein
MAGMGERDLKDRVGGEVVEAGVLAVDLDDQGEDVEGPPLPPRQPRRRTRSVNPALRGSPTSWPPRSPSPAAVR